MINPLKSGMSKGTRIVIFSALVVVVFLVGSLMIMSYSKGQVPSSFDISRKSASEYAQRIVGLVGQTSGNLDLIQKLEKERKFPDILDIILSETEKNNEAKQKAVLLALELEKMAKAIPEITPEKSGQIALVAISSETALIGKLISYNEGLAQLLGLLRERVVKGWIDAEKLNGMVDDINIQIKSINDLNSQFVDLMEKFDNSL